jgi:capsular polysaccharide biosynthesis protein
LALVLTCACVSLILAFFLWYTVPEYQATATILVKWDER